MSDVVTVELTMQNERGLHARAAANFVKALDGLDVEVEVSRLGQTVGGCSIMGLMMLAASLGTSINVSATGNDAQLAIDKLTDLINNKFGEDK